MNNFLLLVLEHTRTSLTVLFVIAATFTTVTFIERALTIYVMKKTKTTIWRLVLIRSLAEGLSGILNILKPFYHSKNNDRKDVEK